MSQSLFPAASSRTADKFVLRLPQGMRERVADVAREAHRSMNSEIIARLEQSLCATAKVVPFEAIEGGSLSVSEAQLLARFRMLSSRQQEALIDVLGPELVGLPSPVAMSA